MKHKNVHYCLSEDRKGRDCSLAATKCFSFFYSKGHIRYITVFFKIALLVETIIKIMCKLELFDLKQLYK